MTKRPDQGIEDLIAHLTTTDANRDPGHANSIMKMAAADLEGFSQSALTAKNFWRTTGKPEDGQCYFIVSNGKPLPDVFVYRVKLDSFFTNGWRIKFSEAEAWASFADIPAYNPTHKSQAA